jgi:hypothetical protein
MIKRYEKDIGQNYRNALQLIVLFFASEYHEFLIWLGIFNPIELEYDERKHIWLVGVMGGIITFIGLVAATCFAVLYKILAPMIS